MRGTSFRGADLRKVRNEGFAEPRAGSVEDLIGKRSIARSHATCEGDGSDGGGEGGDGLASPLPHVGLIDPALDLADEIIRGAREVLLEAGSEPGNLHAKRGDGAPMGGYVAMEAGEITLDERVKAFIRAHAGPDLSAGSTESLLGKVGLGAEMAVEGAMGQPAGFHDLGDADILDPAFAKQS